MDKQHHQDDLSDLERRLSGWRPGSDGLDADAMLFAAGLTAGRSSGQGRLLGPALCGLLAVLAGGLGAWALSERAERQALANLLRDRAPAPKEFPTTVVAVLPEPSPSGYFSLRRQMEQDPNRWVAPLQSGDKQAIGPPPPEPKIIKPRQREGLFD